MGARYSYIKLTYISCSSSNNIVMATNYDALGLTL